MKINLKEKIFNLEKTLYSGQTPSFYFKEKNNTYYGYIKHNNKYKPIKITQKNDKLVIETNAEIEKIKEFLGLNKNLKLIYREIKTDKYIKNSINEFEGLRITKTDPLLTLLIFLSSQNNSMYNIKSFLDILSKKFGRQISFHGTKINLPPKNKELFKLKENDFKECKAGYRAKYMAKTFELIKKDKINLDELKNQSHMEVRHKLKNLHGVGNKVADCISLFAYNNLEAFPIDTHIRKIMQKNYLSNSSDREIREYAKKKWNEYAGYAQQYLYMNKIS